MTQRTRPNDSAFPIVEEEFGLTKREYFAALAMQGLLACSDPEFSECSSEEIAKASVKNADALIKSLND